MLSIGLCYLRNHDPKWLVLCVNGKPNYTNEMYVKRSSDFSTCIKGCDTDGYMFLKKAEPAQILYQIRSGYEISFSTIANLYELK